MSAIFSPCRTWRYTLTRQFAYEACADGCRADYGAGMHKPECRTHLRTVAFIGLNPSTADETTDDPTVRRCIGFAKAWGFERMVMLNAFAYRSTDPRKLREADDPVGPENDRHLGLECAFADLVVCCWGVHGALDGRGDYVRECLTRGGNLHHLGLTKVGHPRHPLYLRGDVTPVPWEA